MHVQVLGDFLVEPSEELLEFDGPVPAVQRPDHLPARGIDLRLSTTFTGDLRLMPVLEQAGIDGVTLGNLRRPRIGGRFAGERMRAWDVEWGTASADLSSWPAELGPPEIATLAGTFAAQVPEARIGSP